MGQCYLYPSGQGYYDITIAIVNATTKWQALSDASDDSYVMTLMPAVPNTFVHTALTIPAGASQIRLYVAVRGKKINPPDYDVYFKPMARLGNDDCWGASHTATEDWQTCEDEFFRPGGGAWSADDIANVQIGLLLTGGGNPFQWVAASRLVGRVTWVDPPSPFTPREMLF